MLGWIFSTADKHIKVPNHQHRPGHENLVSTLDCRLDDTSWCCPCLFKRAALNVGLGVSSKIGYHLRFLGFQKD